MMLFRSAPSPGIPFSLPFGSWQGEGAKVQRGECTRFVPVPQLFFFPQRRRESCAHPRFLKRNPGHLPLVR